MNVTLSSFLPGEESKNFVELERLLSFMLENNINRNATLIALGGGVVGDLAGFAAASYQRGHKLRSDADNTTRSS